MCRKSVDHVGTSKCVACRHINTLETYLCLSDNLKDLIDQRKTINIILNINDYKE
jgi:hypothetical protein